MSSSEESKTPTALLREASAGGNVAQTRQLLAAGATVLPHAVEVGMEAMKEPLQPSPCELAAQHAHVGVLNLLLPAATCELAARETPAEVAEAFWRRVLRAAIRGGSQTAVVSVLDVSKLSLCATDSRREDPPLFEAVAKDRTELVELLCMRGASLCERNVLGHTLLHAAAEHNAHGVFNSILVDNLKDEADQQGNTALHYAVEFGHADLTARLVDAGVDVNTSNTRMLTPLHLAVRGGRVDLAKLLLVVGRADPNKRDYNGNTPLHDAILLDEASLAEEQPKQPKQAQDEDEEENEEDEEVEEGKAWKTERLHVELVELLLSHGADANLENDTTGFSPLHQALRDGYERTARVLLAHDTDAREKSKFGVTPLHVAAAFDASMETWTDLLLHGADPTAVNEDGKTPLELVKSDELRAQAAAAVVACQEV